MAVGGEKVALDPARDTVVNVNAFGDPVPSTRFMGGREHGVLTGGQVADATEADVRAVIAVEGPFAANLLFLEMLTAATGRAVLAQAGRATGTSTGAALLTKSASPNQPEGGNPLRSCPHAWRNYGDRVARECS